MGRAIVHKTTVYALPDREIVRVIEVPLLKVLIADEEITGRTKKNVELVKNYCTDGMYYVDENGWRMISLDEYLRLLSQMRGN